MRDGYKNIKNQESKMKILDGNKISSKILEELKTKVENLKKLGKNICLGIILVGNRKDSEIYVNMKKKRCQEIGILNHDVFLPENTSEEEVLKQVHLLNQNPEIDGILVQLPLPEHIDSEKVISHISLEKDADGFHPENIGKLARGQLQETIIPCTPEGCMELLDRYQIPIKGKEVVIVGKSNVVGLPMSLLFLHRNATVTVCHIHTQDLKEKTSRGDILIVACGQKELITSLYVKEGAVVIDVGINHQEDETKKQGYKVVGDVNFDFVKEKCSYLTPVPGGVGPMTVAMLLSHVVKLATKRM